MSRIKLLSILVVFFVSISCAEAKSEPANNNAGISWLKSGMPQALQLAQKQNLPLFVYWGAVWCPPCNVIKATLFKDDSFIQATDDYISVYLDGDTEEAQKWGEKLKVRGYPTLMILSPDGKEVLRLSTSNAVEDLVSTMNYSKNVWNPITEVLTQALSAQQIDAKIIHSLAMFSWSQDKEVEEHANEYAQKLFELEEKLKSTDLQKNRSIIFMAALILKLESLTGKQVLKQTQQQKYKARIEEILNNAELLKANVLSLAYEAESLVSQLTEDATQDLSVERQHLIQLYVQKMRQYRVLNGITFEHYYATFNPSIDFAEKFDVKLEVSDKKQLTDYISKTLPQTTDKKARQAMISDASYMLFKFGIKDQAKEMLITEMTTSRSPYYLMSTLGFFEKEGGNTAQALEWYEKAYKAAKGPATKLQWYGSFVRNLIKLKPEDKKAIKSNVDRLLSDYTNMADSFFGRNYRVLESLKKSTMKWAEENKENSWIENIKAQGLKKCSLSSKEIYKSSCEKFYKEFI